MRVDEDPRHYPHGEHTDDRPTDDEAALADVDSGEFPPDGHDRDRAPTDEVTAGEPAVGVAEAPTQEAPAEPVPGQLEPTSTVYRDENATQEAAREEEAREEEAREEARDEARDEADRPDDTDVMTAAATGPDHVGETERAEEERLGEDRPEEEHTEAEAAPEAAPEPEELAPGEVPAATSFVLWEAEVVDGYRDRWQQIQLRFIDDPRNAAQQAQSLAGEVCEGLSDALTRHRAELDRWQGAQLEDTEELRMTVRRYRDLLDRLLGL